SKLCSSDRDVDRIDAWHPPQTATGHSRENDPKPHDARSDRGKTTPDRQQLELRAQHFHWLQTTSLRLPQRRCCDEYFKCEQRQKNQARADVHSARDNYEHVSGRFFANPALYGKIPNVKSPLVRCVSTDTTRQVTL